MSQDYTHDIHLHNYGCWTAARAAQRRFPGARTEVVQSVLEKSGFPKALRELYESDPTAAQFDSWHQDMVGHLQVCFQDEGVVASYGQAAKVIAVYLKTVYIARYPESPLAYVAHPPIDRILLQNIKKCKTTAVFTGSLSWTKFGAAEYHAAVQYLREECENQPFWTIERYWIG